MSENSSKPDSFNIFVLLGLFGSLFVISGVFLEWVTVDAGFVTESLTGWDLYTAPEDSTIYPIVVLIGGVFGLVGSLLSFESGLVGSAGSLAILVGTIVVIYGLFSFSGYLSELMAHPYAADLEYSYGFWCSVGGSVALLFGNLTLLWNL
ncbi:hypothetical protein AMET1_0530 [Methanonatronarchaeum thermophilum]|uniref:Uncharacterized protein n=1 Tax=Methanonatronarchaeum thermophilum TaxID=1927129 RepID=A0A1Y3GBT3_9EURY|nr:hypothetical protein [Methanonatronarchaeum thermophilum]OUJ18879.1 hypothetical protein AMET1_0530 [Methanonatronarchaeum thermophilum]